MRVLHFGRIRKVEKGTVGEYALDIQCPWRIEGPEGIVTRRSDLWEAAEDPPDIDWETWDYEENENLQDRRIGEMLKGYDPDTRSFVNATGWFVVEAVQGDRCDRGQHPVRRIVHDIFADLVKGMVIADDMLEVIPLPQTAGERPPALSFDPINVPSGRQRFEPLHNIAQRQRRSAIRRGTPLWLPSALHISRPLKSARAPGFR